MTWNPYRGEWTCLSDVEDFFKRPMPSSDVIYARLWFDSSDPSWNYFVLGFLKPEQRQDDYVLWMDVDSASDKNDLPDRFGYWNETIAYIEGRHLGASAAGDDCEPENEEHRDWPDVLAYAKGEWVETLPIDWPTLRELYRQKTEAGL